MKYIVKQDFFSVVPTFSVIDETNNEVLSIEKIVLSFGANFKAYDNNRNELFEIKHDIANFLPKFEIIYNGQVYATVQSALKFNVNEFLIEPIGWILKGEVWGTRRNYKILCGDLPIASIKKVVQLGGDCYDVDVFDNINAVTVVAVVVILDTIMYSNSN